MSHRVPVSKPDPAQRPVGARASATGPRRGQALRERVAAAIVTSAAEVLARRGAAANMAEVATAAGVARATVYRYFPTRQALLERLAEVAVIDAGARLEEARLKEVAPEEGIRRAVRALLEVGDAFSVLARERVQPRTAKYEEQLLAPLRDLIANGQSSGALREDIPNVWLTKALVDLIASVATSTPALGREDAVAAVSGLFLEGARAAPSSRPRTTTRRSS